MMCMFSSVWELMFMLVCVHVEALRLTSEIFLSLSYLWKEGLLNPQLTDKGSVASQFALGNLQCTGVTGRCHACLPFT